MTFNRLKDNKLGDSINLAPELRECLIERSGAQQETRWLVPRPAAVVSAQRRRSVRTEKEFAGAGRFYPDHAYTVILENWFLQADVGQLADTETSRLNVGKRFCLDLLPTARKNFCLLPRSRPIRSVDGTGGSGCTAFPG